VTGKSPRVPERLVLTVAETAELLGVSRWLVQQAARRGELPHIRLGRRILFPQAAVMAIVQHSDPQLLAARSQDTDTYVAAHGGPACGCGQPGPFAAVHRSHCRMDRDPATG
jgi:excisionase family DNA binding protein